MPIHLLVLLSLLISIQSNGDPVKSCLNRLGDLNQPGSQKSCEPEPASEFEVITARLKCLEVLCPTGLGEMTKIEGKKSDLSFIGAGDRKNLDQLLTEHYARSLKEELAQLKIAKEKIENRQSIEAPEQIKLVRLYGLLAKIPYATKTLKGIDQAATKKDFPDMTPLEMKALADAYNFELNSSKKAAPILSEDLQHLSRTMTSQQLQEAVGLAWAEYKSNKDDFLKKSKLPDSEKLNDPVYSGALSERLASGKFSLNDIESLRKASTETKFLNWAWTDKKLASFVSRGNVVVDKIVAEDGGRLLNDRLRLIQSYLKDPKDKSNALYNWLNTIKNDCASEVSYARQILPTPKAQEEFRKKELEWRSEYVAGLGQKMSKESAKMLGEAATAWKMSLPPTAEEQLQNILQPLKDKVSRPEPVLDDQTKDLQFSKWLGSNIDFYGEVNYGRDTTKICENAAIELLSDRVQTGSDNFSLGPVFGLGEEWAKSIAFHEYGHLVSGIMKNEKGSQESKAWFDRTRKCLKKMQPKADHVEEDWADMVAASLKTLNRRCQSMNATSTLPILNSKGLSHSTDFFRALHHEVIQKGSVPKECQRFTTEGAQQVKIKSCL